MSTSSVTSYNDKYNTEEFEDPKCRTNAICNLCMLKSISVAWMGRTALASHARGAKHWIVEDLAKSSSKLRRLPEDILSQLDGGQPRHCLPKATAVVKDTHKQTKRKHWKDTGHSVDGFHVTTDADFIPLETGTTVQFGVMPLNKMGKAAPALAKASADFRQNMLYGSRIRREPAKTLLDRQLKLKAAHKDSLVKRTH
ncbi:uncharacterized protein LOC134531004 isoform X2 [Bacillus rossius redtenbacheri]|uniref:uncharacterized protein LOC134531004 isoform X2 n=1 Tax=Bacillus rossius redtenbacheri TaxID=93214 RepID=UPI002FDCDB6F